MINDMNDTSCAVRTCNNCQDKLDDDKGFFCSPECEHEFWDAESQEHYDAIALEFED